MFAKSRKEDILTGPFSILEYFVLANIVDSCEDNGLETDAPTILSIYNQVVSINSDINPRKQPDIEYFMLLYKNNLTIFLNYVTNKYRAILSSEPINELILITPVSTIVLHSLYLTVNS